MGSATVSVATFGVSPKALLIFVRPSVHEAGSAFAFGEYGGHEDYDWSADWQSESYDDMTITGLEKLRAVYASAAFRDKQFRDAGYVAVCSSSSRLRLSFRNPREKPNYCKCGNTRKCLTVLPVRFPHSQISNVKSEIISLNHHSPLPLTVSNHGLLCVKDEDQSLLGGVFMRICFLRAVQLSAIQAASCAGERKPPDSEISR